jgi:hypothetical protein
MSKVKYTKEIADRAIEMRLTGKSIPEIITATGMKKPSLQKLFQKNHIKLNERDKVTALARRWLNHEPVVDGKKQCSHCGDWKSTEEFHKNNNRISGRVSACKDCYSLYYEANKEPIKARVTLYRIANPEKKKERDRNYYIANKEHKIRSAKEWDQNNAEKRKEITNNYSKRNQKKKNARTARYRAAKIQATPKWLTQQQIDEMARIYTNCPPGFDVDHIIPLRGKGVRGLHVPWNLQYLSHLDNMRKSNNL